MDKFYCETFVVPADLSAKVKAKQKLSPFLDSSSLKPEVCLIFVIKIGLSV